MSNSSESLKRILITDPQRQLDYSIDRLIEHDQEVRPKFPKIFAKIRTLFALGPQDEVSDFPRSLKEYRKLTSRVQSLMRMYTEKGEGYDHKKPDTIHAEVYHLGHDLGTYKDIIKAGRYYNHPDVEQLEQDIVNNTFTFTDQDRTVMSPSRIEARVAQLVQFIEQMATTEGLVPLSVMHDLRKQLRGVSYTIELRMIFAPDPSFDHLDYKVRELVHELGELHDQYVIPFTVKAKNKAEFDQIYDEAEIAIPDEIKVMLRDLLKVF